MLVIDGGPGGPEILRELHVTPFINYVYQDVKDDLLIKRDNVSRELICIGAFDREKGEVVSLTLEKIQKSRQYGFKIDEKN